MVRERNDCFGGADSDSEDIVIDKGFDSRPQGVNVVCS